MFNPFWVTQGKSLKATHLIVVCDTYDNGDYPVYVYANQNVREVEADYRSKSMQRVMEVYWLEGDTDAQMKMFRSFTYGPTKGFTR